MNPATSIRVTRYVGVVARWVTINATVFALVVCAGLYVINNVIGKVYVSSVTLQLPAVDLATPESGTLVDATELRPEFENILLSPDFLLGIVKELGLDKEWGHRLNSDTNPLPDVDALTRMERIVRMKVLRDSNRVEISAASDVPQEAADIANAIAERYKAGREAGENQAMENRQVIIVKPAEVSADPVKPNKHFDFIVVVVGAALLGLLAASFVEMVFLFVRAGERTES